MDYNPKQWDSSMPISAESYGEFIEACMYHIPEYYDGDIAAEDIILNYIRDLENAYAYFHRLFNPTNNLSASRRYSVLHWRGYPPRVDAKRDRHDSL